MDCAVNDANLVAILKIGAHAGSIQADGQAQTLQFLARTDTGQLQQLRGVEGAARDDHLAAGINLERCAGAVRLSRLRGGAAPTVGGAFVVTLGAALLGLVRGVIAGSTHGLRSAVMNHILDTLLSIPSLLLAIIVVAFAGPHLSHAMFAVWLALLPRMVRSVYSMVHDELEKEYVIAARLDGASTLNILWFAVLPNITSGLVTEITRALSMAILDIAALGFLDLGAQLPSPEWGAMLGDALELIYVAPWTVMLPGAAIMISVLLVNLLGDGIRRAIIAGVE